MSSRASLTSWGVGYYVKKLCKIFIQHFSSAKKFAVINEIAVKSKKHKNFKNPKKFNIYSIKNRFGRIKTKGWFGTQTSV